MVLPGNFGEYFYNLEPHSPGLFHCCVPAEALRTEAEHRVLESRLAQAACLMWHPDYGQLDHRFGSDGSRNAIGSPRASFFSRVSRARTMYAHGKYGEF